MKCPVCGNSMIVEPDGVNRCYCCGTEIGKPKTQSSVCVETSKEGKGSVKSSVMGGDF